MLPRARRAAWLTAYDVIYRALVRPWIFRNYNAQAGHELALYILKNLDGDSDDQRDLRQWREIILPDQPCHVGGVDLPIPLMLAAGFVKGLGFAREEEALAAVTLGENIIPGWQSMPHLVGPVEFGSFTRYPRLGNEGPVLWRDKRTRSTQNRVGLRNPGARAAAAFLADKPLPTCWGINLAVSPGVTDPEQESEELLEALGFFIRAGVHPSWYTLNLSCPNTEDDPQGHQTNAKARRLCTQLAAALAAPDIPLWVKVGPGLADQQYDKLMRALAESGARAVIATNTQARLAPDGQHMAGVGGGRLHSYAVEAASYLALLRDVHRYPVDVIGCGGILDRATYHDFQRAGVQAGQYWSALIYSGPLAPALILRD